jgi:uncharacterized membrane protein YesL
MKTTPHNKSFPRFLIGLAGALIGICDLYLIYVEAMYACPVSYNFEMAVLITLITLGIPVLVAATLGAQAALRLPRKLRLALAGASLLLVALPIVNALPHAVPSYNSTVCAAPDF